MDDIRTRFQNRLAELRQAEGMAWAELHAIQGRIAEVQKWIAAEDKEEPALTLGELEHLINAAAEQDE